MSDTQKDIKLLSCPFCGSKAVLKKGNGVHCTNESKCGIVGPKNQCHDHLAIEAWNNRLEDSK